VVNKTKKEDLKTMGEWSWNSRLLNEKVIRGNDNECWPSTNFAQTRNGPLFGVIKNGKRQMTQVCRILYRDWFNIDCEESEITHTCGNKNCLNKNHWEVKPNKRHGLCYEQNQDSKPNKKYRSKSTAWWNQ